MSHVRSINQVIDYCNYIDHYFNSLVTTTSPPQITTQTSNMLTRSTLTSSTRLSVAAARSLRAGSTWSQVPQGYVTPNRPFFPSIARS